MIADVLVRGVPNKSDVCSDPGEMEFEYSIVDDDGVCWWAVATEKPSAFVDWAKAPS